MAIEAWFPLAIYYEDLAPPLEIRERMLAHLAPFIAEHEATESRGFAWTGDIRGCWQLHKLEAFAWLRSQVERHAIRYARELGVNLAVMGFYFQRAWPVLSRKGEMVGPHSHPNASLSAVYFLRVPGDPEKAGRLQFHNEAGQNSLGRGFAADSTRGIAHWNPLNYQKVSYAPIEGRLVLFPSRQHHSVERNQDDVLRISISFDIALTCSRHADPGQHEFLAPPPEEWEEFTAQAGDEIGVYAGAGAGK
jgi:uncharacterized protein (TIGR02466 family)